MNPILERLPAVVFLVLFVLLWLAEAGAAAVAFDGGPRKRRNLAVTIINFALGGVGASMMLAAATTIARAGWGLSAWADGALTVLVGALLLDLTDYWRHRASHAWTVLWRLHRVHHSDQHVDVTTALRSHPLEQVLRPLFLSAAIIVFGIPVLSVLVYPLLGLPVLLWQHANVRFPPRLDRALAWLVSTPGMHRIHHSRLARETNSNYATGLTCWDRLFGSFSTSTKPHGFGLDGFDDARHQGLRGMLLDPWRAPSPIVHRDESCRTEPAGQ